MVKVVEEDGKFAVMNGTERLAVLAERPSEDEIKKADEMIARRDAKRVAMTKDAKDRAEKAKKEAKVKA